MSNEEARKKELVNEAEWWQAYQELAITAMPSARHMASVLSTSHQWQHVCRVGS